MDAAICDFINYVFFRAPGPDGKGRSNRLICSIKHFLPEFMDKINLTHKEMVGWAKFVRIQQTTPCTHVIELG